MSVLNTFSRPSIELRKTIGPSLVLAARRMRNGRLSVIDKESCYRPRDARSVASARHTTKPIYQRHSYFWILPVSRCLHTVRGETRLCPVCDAEIDADAKRCNSCQTDLSLFDVESDGDADLEERQIPSSASIDDLLDSISDGKEMKGDFFETIKRAGKNGAASDDVLAEPARGPRASVPGVSSGFECPVCGTAVATDARTCPSCGAEFAEEVAEEFECPACGASVEASATTCPSCGVTFATEEEPEAAPKTRTVVAGKPAPRAPVPPETRPPVPPEARESGLRKRLERAKAVRAATPPSASPADRRALYKELPRLVNEVKPMLLSARKVGVDIEEPKRLINDAIAAGEQEGRERAGPPRSQLKGAPQGCVVGEDAGRGGAHHAG